MSETELLTQVLAKLECIEAEQRRTRQLLEHGVTPPEWVSGKALAVALGLRGRGAEYWRNELGVIPVDGVVCRKMGKAYEYRVEGCRELIERYKALDAATRRSLREAWEQQCKEVA